jgi:acid phosphatase type 7
VEHLWEILYDAGVDVVLNWHDHNYQRFAPQDPQGRADPEAGIRQFVVGTGGRGLYQIPHPIANAEVYDDNTHGVLELTLHPKRYDWEFVPVEGETFSDSGVALCH